jgi:Zn-dependent protease with chaperone function
MEAQTAEQVTQLTQYPVIGLTILAAIPVVSYALWAEYWGRYLDEARREKPREFDRAAELRKIRWAGIYVFITQALLYLSSAPLRMERPVLAAMIFMASLFLQSQIQYGLEQKAHGPRDAAKPTGTAGPETQAQTDARAAAEHARSGFVAFLWTLVTVGGYLAAVWGCAAIAAGIGVLAGASKETMAVLLLTGAATGIFAGVAMIFATGPVHLRKLLPTARLEDPARRELFEECFRRAGVPAPEFWVVQLDARRFTNAMMAGFRGGRGWFRPGLFVSRSMLEAFEPEELRAIILHEASHARLGHLRKRLLGTIGAVLGTSFVLTGILLAAHAFLPAESVGPLRIVLTIASVLAPLWLLRAQGERQELQADACAVLELGADFEAFSRALRRMDSLNGSSSDRKDPNAYLSPASAHPTTEKRLMLLAKRVEERAMERGRDERRAA